MYKHNLGVLFQTLPSCEYSILVIYNIFFIKINFDFIHLNIYITCTCMCNTVKSMFYQAEQVHLHVTNVFVLVGFDDVHTVASIVLVLKV